MKKRFGIIAVAAALLGIMSGCAAPTPGGSGPTTTAVASQSPTPTVASAPTVRVPATCDQLVPAAVRDAATGTHVALASDLPGGHSALMYADRRVGALVCSWEGGITDPTQPWLKPSVWVGVLPGSSPDAFSFFKGNSGAEDQSDPFFVCGGLSPATCAFGGTRDGYQWLGTVSVGSGSIDQTAARAVFDSARSVVAGLGAPGPLWQPQGGSLRGVTTTDDFAPLDRLQAAAGTGPLRVVKSEGGENEVSALGSSEIVGGNWAFFIADGSEGFSVGVLPGGGFGFDDRHEHPLAGTTDIRRAAIGEEAYFSRPGSTVPGDTTPSRDTLLDVKVKNSWVQVGSVALTDDQLLAVARAVIENLS
ncbi:hypothetical protein ACRAWB_01565 [Leifsonia poae]|uniref:hypothetical protein n=1 Tax=Leifsonia poae TaxID=110933 RepID=UPI003D69B6DD